MASGGSPIDKPQRGRPKRAQLSDVNINKTDTRQCTRAVWSTH